MKIRLHKDLVTYQITFKSVFHKEKYLKISYGHRLLKNRLGNDSTNIPV